MRWLDAVGVMVRGGVRGCWCARGYSTTTRGILAEGTCDKHDLQMFEVVYFMAGVKDWYCGPHDAICLEETCDEGINSSYRQGAKHRYASIVMHLSWFLLMSPNLILFIHIFRNNLLRSISLHNLLRPGRSPGLEAGYRTKPTVPCYTTPHPRASARSRRPL